MGKRHEQGGDEMEQAGFFDLSDCYTRLDKLGDALVQMDALVPWDSFRGRLRQAWREDRGRGGAVLDECPAAGSERWQPMDDPGERGLYLSYAPRGWKRAMPAGCWDENYLAIERRADARGQLFLGRNMRSS